MQSVGLYSSIMGQVQGDGWTAMQVHPDVNPAVTSTDDAVLLNEAYAVLQLASLSPQEGNICLGGPAA